MRLYVSESFRAPAWFKTASAAETERALAIAAALMPLLNGEVPPGLRVQQQISDAASKARQDAHQKYEEQLKGHESALQRLTREMTTHLESLTARLREAEEARDAALEEARRVNQQVTAESAADATVSDPEKAHIGTHFGALAAHAGEMFELYAAQSAALATLTSGLTDIRAKSMVWYRASKRLSTSIPWLDTAKMQLPFEGAFEHAIGRTWNNMTTSKANQLEAALGREAVLIAKTKESRSDTPPAPDT